MKKKRPQIKFELKEIDPKSVQMLIPDKSGKFVLTPDPRNGRFFEMIPRALSLILLLFILPPANAQDSVKQTEVYCELICKQDSFSPKWLISAEYGKLSEAYVKKGAVPQKSIFGEWEKFSSVVDALNYMNSLGWEYVSVMPMTVNGIGKIEYHYLLRYPIKKAP